ncbi:MAG: MIP/aquaporin family protein [Pseudomonadota bacterium]
MLMQRLLAEGLGTCLLLTTIVGSGIMGDALANGQPGAALLPHAIAIGAMLFVLITLFGPVSGAHFNPAVTMVFTIRRELSPGVALAYVTVQIAAGVLGVWLAHLMFDLDILQVSERVRSGPGQWSAEVVATAGLIFVIFAGLRVAPHLIPVLVGLYIMAALWFTASTSFANPAVTVARALTATFAGIQPADVLPFLVSQILGALLGWQLASLVYLGQPRD